MTSKPYKVGDAIARQFSSKTIFLLIFLFGAMNVQQIGISYDEVQQRKIGLVNTRYIFETFAPWLIPGNINDIPKLSQFGDALFGVSFEVPLIILERILNLQDSREIYFFRHVITHMLFVFASYLFYLLLKEVFSSNRIAWVGTGLLYSNPRIYSESYYNNKDIALLSAFLIAMYTANRYGSKFTTQSLILHSLATAFLINIRVIGLLMIPATLFLILSSDKDFKLKLKLRMAGIYLFLVALLSYVSFPFLWSNPVRNLVTVIMKFSDYPTQEVMTFNGKLVSSQSLPIEYLFRWILVTSPLITITLMLFGGLAFVGVVLTKKRNIERKQIKFLTTNILIFLPAVGWIVFSGATLYNGWRHVYFLWIPIVVYAVFALRIFENLRTRFTFIYIAVYITIVGSLALNLNWFLHNKPHSHLYFNAIAQRPLTEYFDLDYWGVSNFPILEKILIDQPINQIKVSTICDTPLTTTRYILRKQERFRIEVTDIDQDPTYVLNNFFKCNFDLWKDRDSFFLWEKVLVGNDTVVEVYKRY